MTPELKNLHCPRWAELPDIPLYLDQLVMVVQQALEPFAEQGEPVVTKTMINNYVKHRIMNPPEGKKYGRGHMARVIAITVLKRVYSMQEIHTLIETTTAEYGVEKGYDAFCERLEAFLRSDEVLLGISAATYTELLDVTLAAVVCKLAVQQRVKDLELNFLQPPA